MAADDPIMASMAGRYASALFELASEENKLADVERDLVTVQGLLDMSEDLRRAVRSPVFSAEEQGRAIGAVLEKAGIGALTLNFFKLLAKNRRLFAAPDMIKAFRTLAARSRGEVAAEVASAVTLSDEHVALLKETLKATVGKDVTLSTKVDPGLLGGLIVKIGSRMIDSSLRTKLASLKVALKGSA